MSSYGALAAVLLPHPGLITRPASAHDASGTRGVDGDRRAVILNGRPESVRLIGVETPELHDSDKLHRDAERTG